MTTARHTSLFRIRQIPAVFAMALLGFSSFTFMLSALPVRAVQVGVPDALAGTITTVLLAATVGIQLLSPMLLRRCTVRTLLVWGVVLLGLPSPFYLLADELWSLYLVSVFRGLGFGLLTVVAALAIRLAAPPGREGEAVGVFGLAAALPSVLGVPVGAGLTLAGAFTPVAWLATLPLLAVLVAPWTAAELVPRTPAQDLPLRAIGRLLVPPVGLLFVATAVGGGVMTVLPLELTDGPLVAAALVVFGVFTSLTRWRIGRLTDRRGHAGIPQLLVAVGAAGLLLLALGLDADGTRWWAVFFGGALAGTAYGALQSVSLDLSFAHVSAGQAPLASATWNAAFDAGTATGAAAVAAVAATTWQGTGAMAVSAAALILAGVVFTVTSRVLRRA